MKMKFVQIRDKDQRVIQINPDYVVSFEVIEGQGMIEIVMETGRKFYVENRGLRDLARLANLLGGYEV